MQIKKGYENITSDLSGYYLAGKKYPRVSTILRNIDKRPLIKWAVRVGCEKVDELLEPHFDLSNMEFGFKMNAKERMLDLAKNEHIRLFEEAANYGSLVHDKIECWLKKCDFPKKSYSKDWLEPANASLESFKQFWKEGEFELIASEMAVIHKDLGYGGRIDILVKQGDEIVILDIKTGKSIWKQAKIQCALYAMALDEMCEWLLKIMNIRYDFGLKRANPNPTFIKQISKAIICHIPKANPKVKAIPVAGDEFEACKQAGLDLVRLHYNLEGIR